MEDGEEQPFKPLASVDPGTLSFAVRVMASTVGTFALPTPRVTKYKDFKGDKHSRGNDGPPGQDEKFKDYVFTYHEPGPGEKHTFYFARVRPPAEEFTPIASESYPTSAPHPWDDVLLQLGFEENLQQPMTIEVGGEVVEVGRVKELVKFLPGGVMATDFDVLIFMSHRPFQRSFKRLDIPVPTEVSWTVRNCSGSRGRCLHGRVIIPALPEDGGTLMQGYGTVDTPFQDGQDIEIPATNHPRNRKHVSHRHQEKQAGMWVLEVRVAHPPRGVRAIVKGGN